MSDGTIDIFVPGIPQPGGSKKAFFNKKVGRAIVTDANPKAKSWKACVAQAGSDAVITMLDGPLAVRMDFVFPRPKSHYGTGKKAGVLKPDAPAFHTVRPDAGKAARSTEDALTGIVWRDDSQISTELLTKRYGDQAGCRIRVKQDKL